jgi:hypothetical protein
MTHEPSLDQQIRDRAGDRCEYCRMHQSLQGATFHIEHIIPRSRGGLTLLDNLALACPSCNLAKSDRIDAVDADSGQPVSLFDPRQHSWSEHFRFRGTTIEPLTAIGRATVGVLDLNHPRREQIREAESRFGLFPPTK